MRLHRVTASDRGLDRVVEISFGRVMPPDSAAELDPRRAHIHRPSSLQPTAPKRPSTRSSPHSPHRLSLSPSCQRLPRRTLRSCSSESELTAITLHLELIVPLELTSSSPSSTSAPSHLSDLRIHDNPLLQPPSKPRNKITHVLPIFVFDERVVELSAVPGFTRSEGHGEARSRVLKTWRCGANRVK